jgi:hypothetical protein
MLTKKIIIGLSVVCGSILVMVGCYKDKTVILDTTAEITRKVTFSQDLIPMFDKSCNTSGCHSQGGQTPNLTASNAFSSLTIGNYINKATPENSILYQKMIGKRGTPMPPSGSNKDYNALVLAWIKQGANNN